MVSAAKDAATALDKKDCEIVAGVDVPEEHMDPPYFWPLWSAAGWTASVDMVRVTLRCREVAEGTGVCLLARELDELCRLLTAAKVGAARSVDMSSPGPGQYRRIWTLTVGECRAKEATVTIGIGRRSGKKVEELEGFFECNPNKVAHCLPFRDLHRMVLASCHRAELSRADLAFDYPIERWRAQAYKDRRNWSYVESSGAPPSPQDRDTYSDLVSRSGRTTYLGVRSSPGLVKVYDKEKESGLSRPMTRVEVTVAGADTPADLARRWPILQILPGDLASYNDASTAGLVFRLAARGEEAEAILAEMEPRRKRRSPTATARPSAAPRPGSGSFSATAPPSGRRAPRPTRPPGRLRPPGRPSWTRRPGPRPASTPRGPAARKVKPRRKGRMELHRMNEKGLAMKKDTEIDECGGDKAGGLRLPARVPKRAADCLRNIRHALNEGATAEDYVRRYDDERAMLIMAGLMTPAGDWTVPLLDNDYAAEFGVGAGSERAVVYLALAFYWGTDVPEAWAADEVAGWFGGFYDAIKRLDRGVAAVPLTILAARWDLAVRE